MIDKRLIEEAFPLKQASLDSVHEKNVRHGHISTLHIWPARRPLAASRAAIIAALLPDPGDANARAELVRKIGGELVGEGGEIKTRGGVLRWGRENTPDMDYFRDEIKKAFGGRAPKVMDMFAGGGAIPLEAMRLGCDVTAIDYNPVAWFLLKCTLEYPARLAGKRWPLPSPTPKQADADFGLMAVQGKLAVGELQPSLGEAVTQGDGDLSDHVLYWGKWVLDRVRSEIAEFYPTLRLKPEEPASANNLSCPTVAYLWTRTIPHPDPSKNALQVPLLKTMWLCKKQGKKRALRLIYNEINNAFEYEVFTPTDDAEVTKGTMATNGVMCPPTRVGEAGTFIRLDYIQKCGKEGLTQAACTAVIVDVPRSQNFKKGDFVGKEYRSVTQHELEMARVAEQQLAKLIPKLPYGLPNELLPINPRRMNVQMYGLDSYAKLFNNRQLLALTTFVLTVREVHDIATKHYADPEALVIRDAIVSYLALTIDRLADYNSTICSWDASGEYMSHTFMKFALPMKWDYAEVAATNDTTGSYIGGVEWVARVVKHVCEAATSGEVKVLNESAVDPKGCALYDAIITDPPYYFAIPYSDIANFFYVWLRRSIGTFFPPHFDAALSPRDGELVTELSHKSIPSPRTKDYYESGMAEAFSAACASLKPDGRMVVVFAHKEPDAWETLVSAIIRAGFTVTASWPIDTEMGTRTNAHNSASLSSSVWLVCRKRPSNAGKGWYKQVQPRMKERITERLRYFWDEGVRGPDFLWAAIGPGLEAFSAYDEVRRNDGAAFTISEFINEVRRLTTDFALGQILHGGTEGLDDWTRFALMHVQNFSTGGAPVGEAILLAGAYGLDLNMITGPKGILTKGKSKTAKTNDEEEESVNDETSNAGSTVLRLFSWDERKRDDLGEPLESGDWHVIDAIHRLMREWASGDVTRAAIYADHLGLGTNDLFWRVAQAFVEMGALQSKERSMLEAIISWGRGRTPQFNYASNGTTATVAPQRPFTLTMDFNQE